MSRLCLVKSSGLGGPAPASGERNRATRPRPAAGVRRPPGGLRPPTGGLRKTLQIPVFAPKTANCSRAHPLRSTGRSRASAAAPARPELLHPMSQIESPDTAFCLDIRRIEPFLTGRERPRRALQFRSQRPFGPGVNTFPTNFRDAYPLTPVCDHCICISRFRWDNQASPLATTGAGHVSFHGGGVGVRKRGA
jgi:hypothetical protein